MAYDFLHPDWVGTESQIRHELIDKMPSYEEACDRLASCGIPYKGPASLSIFVRLLVLANDPCDDWSAEFWQRYNEQ